MSNVHFRENQFSPLCVLSISLPYLKSEVWGVSSKETNFLILHHLIEFLSGNCFPLVDSHFSVNHSVNKASVTIFHIAVCLRLSRTEAALYTLEIILVIKEYGISTKPESNSIHADMRLCLCTLIFKCQTDQDLFQKVPGVHRKHAVDKLFKKGMKGGHRNQILAWRI